MLVVGCSAAPGSASKHCAGNFLACKLAGCNDLCQDRIIPKASHSGAGVSTHYFMELANQMATVSHSRRAKSGTTGKSSVLFCSLLWGPLSSAKEQKLGTWKERLNSAHQPQALTQLIFNSQLSRNIPSQGNTTKHQATSAAAPPIARLEPPRQGRDDPPSP